MKIKNKTDWDTRDIRKFVTRICKDEGRFPDTLEVWNHTGRGFYRAVGRGTLHGGTTGGWIKLLFPMTKKVLTDVAGGVLNRVDHVPLTEISGSQLNTIAGTLVHEIAHNRGLNHDEMDCNGIRERDYSHLIGDIVIHKKPIIEKPKVDLIALRKEHAQFKLKQAETKLKRCQTIVKKWKRKVEYYGN